MIATKLFLDSNVLLYAYDSGEPVKQRHAFALLDALAGENEGAISSQVLGEFFAVGTRRIHPPLSPKEAHDVVSNLAVTWRVLDITRLIVAEACRGVLTHGFHYWDAQIWATARLNQIPVVLSEDFANDSVIEGVRFVNPFAADFRLQHVI